MAISTMSIPTSVSSTDALFDQEAVPTVAVLVVGDANTNAGSNTGNSNTTTGDSNTNTGDPNTTAGDSNTTTASGSDANVLVLELTSPTSEEATSGVGTFGLVLTTAPDGVVEVDMVSDGILYVAPSTVVFDASNWSQPQTITVALMGGVLSNTSTTGLIALMYPAPMPRIPI